MSFLSQERTLSLVVFGYIRRLEESSSSLCFIAHVIKELIIAYSHDYFSWFSRKDCSAYRVFEDNPSKAEKLIIKHYSFLVSANNLSSEMYHKFEWEVTIEKSQIAFHGPIALMVGFVAYPMEDSIPIWDTYFRAKNQFGVLAYSYNSCLAKYSTKCFGIEFAKQTENYDIKYGDRFCIRFDFKQRKCSFGYNDVFTEDVFTDIPSKVIPAVCCYGPMIISCTKWNNLGK